MKLKEARQIAEKYVEILKPFTERIEMAGSIRRKKPEVRDIEIVCIAKVEPINNLFTNQDTSYRPLDVFITHHKPQNWKLIKNGVKYKQILLPEGIKLDMFIANKENWGNIFLIRTGSMEFSKWVMGIRTRQVGLRQKDGYLLRGEERIHCLEEIDVFRLLKMKYVEPKYRNEFFVTGSGFEK